MPPMRVLRSEPSVQSGDRGDGDKAVAGSLKRQKRKAATSSTSLAPFALAEATAETKDDDTLALASDEEKKEKNRNSVRRSYYRKIETLGELRAHADDLRRQYNDMLQQWEGRFLPGSDDADNAKKSALLLRYMELSRLRDELWTENQQLQDSFEDREKSAFRLQRLFDVNYQLMDHSAHGGANNGERVSFPSPVLIMEEMSFEAFTRFAQDALSQVESFLANKQQMTATNQVLGWKSSHVVDDNALRFYFEKQFTSPMAVHDVAQKAWETLTSPEKHSELYARTLHVRFHVMQIFDSNSCVLYRTMEKEGEDSITTALIVMTRIERSNNGGCLIICKGLKKAEHKLHMESMSEYTLHKKKIWRESMYWLSVEKSSDGADEPNAVVHDGSALASSSFETCRLKVAHGGIMNNMGDRSPSFWLFENLLIALRWESKLGLETKPSGASPSEPLLSGEDHGQVVHSE
uniref:START domain-containing protein n=1 Tax=Globisporangium ultimum (strain ATCC 200006 / CBS 805.95 / DAOM BR144) TaxID=431595 RepID=K3WNS4_GLOUD